jgi:hypothetical protein
VRLEDKKSKLLKLMSKSARWYTPTELGIAMGKPYYSASAFTCPVLKLLVAEGWVEANRGVYRLVKWTTKNGISRN